MARYHFNVLGDVVHYDVVGVELASVEDAKRESWRYVSDMLSTDPSFSLGDEWQVEVTDPSGMVLFRLKIAMTDGPATFRIVREPERHLH